MNHLLQFFTESADREQGFRMMPAIVMIIIFLAFFGATAYVLVSSF